MSNKPFSVDLWGSDPENNNDDCWDGEDFETYEEALAYYKKVEGTSYAPPHTVAVIILSRRMDGNNRQILEKRENAAHDPERRAREDEAFRRQCRSEGAMQAGMGLGCAGYNDYMGY